MCNCRNVSSSTQTYQPAPIQVVVDNCSNTRDYILELYHKLSCIKQHNSSIPVNYPMGLLLTMLNLNNYCKYSTQQIEETINNNNVYSC